MLNNKKLKKVEGNIYGMGVYCFKKDNVVLYVGSGMMNDRLQNHIWNLERNKYDNTNKTILQKVYDNRELTFEVLHFSEFNSEYLHMTVEQKENLQKALGTLEEFYIGLYKDTVCNKPKKIKKSINHGNMKTTLKKRKANQGKNNPNCSINDEIASEILWLKQNAKMKNEEIIHIYSITESILHHIGYDRWLHVESIKPEWFNEAK